MNELDTVTIVGVGLIGGSIGLALQKRGLARHVIGVSRRASTLRTARQRGAVTRTTTDISRGVTGSQLVVVCTPVGRIVEDVRRVAELAGPAPLITDVGSTKAEIVVSLQRALNGDVRFVGSHPLAGSEKTGPKFASDDLFEDRVVVITPTKKTKRRDTAEIEQFWTALGARVVRMTPGEHDAAVAATSHVPHLVASALAAATPEKHLPLAAGGWQDTTRIAAGDAELWQQILAENRGQVLKSLDKFEKVLASFRRALERNDPARIAQLLEAGKQTRDAVAS